MNSSDQYAMKVMSKAQILGKGERTVISTIREREMLAKLHHPFIVNVWGSVQDDQNLYLVHHTETSSCILCFKSKQVIMRPT